MTESEGAPRLDIYRVQNMRVLGQYLNRGVVPYRLDSGFSYFWPDMALTVLAV